MHISRSKPNNQFECTRVIDTDTSGHRCEYITHTSESGIEILDKTSHIDIWLRPKDPTHLFKVEEIKKAIRAALSLYEIPIDRYRPIYLGFLKHFLRLFKESGQLAAS